MTNRIQRISLGLTILAALLCFSGCFERFTQKKAADSHAGESAEEHAAHSHAGETPEEHAAHSEEGGHSEGDGHDHGAQEGEAGGKEAGK